MKLSWSEAKVTVAVVAVVTNKWGTRRIPYDKTLPFERWAEKLYEELWIGESLSFEEDNDEESI